ncbi:IS4 family transposase [Roseimarinus sediminis]|uniref:IS4 family transposase n=1 Tax=Roseimarinus sediminis TaxID=1610899 RepID=UPI003D21B238
MSVSYKKLPHFEVRVMTSRVEHKNSDLVSIFHKQSGWNLARVKFFVLMISALCKVQTVGFEKLASAFDSHASTSSSLRRIQRFMADYILDADLIARLIFRLLPHKPPFRLAMDRTNWKFGQQNINVLVIAIVYQGVAFPLLFKLLPKFGNSNTSERIELVERYIRLFGRETLECLTADREFVGERWIKYLNDRKIRYHIRIRENFWVLQPHNGKQVKASWMFADLPMNGCRVNHRIVYLNNQLCYLSASKGKGKDGKPELQIIISFNKPEEALEVYKERWQIETAFRALKTSGFNIEDTHLSDIERIEKLFALVIVAFTWAYLVGDFLDKYIKPIPIKKHGKRAKSLFKHGLTYIATVLLNAYFQDDIGIYKFLSCT